MARNLSQNKTKTFQYHLTPTQSRIVRSRAVVLLAFAAKGEGKTFSMVHRLINIAQYLQKPVTGAIVRDTLENMKTSTAPSIRRAIGSLAEFKYDYKQLIIHTEPQVTAHLFGIDDDASLTRLQGPEFDFVWLEEPAPLQGNAGLPESVFNAALPCALRGDMRFGTVQISMNPADKDHWTYKRFFESEVLDPNFPEITKEIIQIPVGENPHISSLARQATAVAYQNDPASYARYVEGRFAPVYRGVAVAEHFNYNTHVSPEPLAPAEGLETILSFDGWHYPACLFAQVTPTGRLIILDEVMGPGDIRTLLLNKVKPLLNSPRWKDKPGSLTLTGDPTLAIPDQSTRSISAAKVVEKELDLWYQGGPGKWANRKDGMNRGLAGPPFYGKSAVLIDPRCRMLIKGLEGAWYYDVDKAGKVKPDQPPCKKGNDVNHICDCFAYLCCKAFPVTNNRKYAEALIQSNVISMNRAKGYAVA